MRFIGSNLIVIVLPAKGTAVTTARLVLRMLVVGICRVPDEYSFRMKEPISEHRTRRYIFYKIQVEQPERELHYRTAWNAIVSFIVYRD